MKNFKNIPAVCILLLISACSNGSQNTENKTGSENSDLVTANAEIQNKIGIKTDTLRTAHISGTVHVNGNIDVPPQNMVSVSIPLGGYLVSSKLLPGMHINRGEVIAVLEDQQYIQLQQDYLTALIQMDQIRNEYERQAEMNKSKASSDKIFEQSKSDYLSQKVLLQALSEKLKLIGINPAKLNENNISKSINVQAPINGFVSKVNVNVGRYINPSDVMFELVNPDDIHLNLTLYEKDLKGLAIGSKVKAFTNHDPDKKYNCDVILIGKDVSREGYVEVHCHFDTYDNTLIPGMYMNADIETGAAEMPVLPEKAILRHGGTEYVFVKSADMQFRMVEVLTGMRNEGLVEIKNVAELKGKDIVTEGAYELLMMLKNRED